MNYESTSTTTLSASGASAEAVSRRAYEIWEQEGRPEGSDFRHWLQAEQELSSATPAIPVPPAPAVAVAPSSAVSERPAEQPAPRKNGGTEHPRATPPPAATLTATAAPRASTGGRRGSTGSTPPPGGGRRK
jgi:hypothetical protein